MFSLKFSDLKFLASDIIPMRTRCIGTQMEASPNLWSPVCVQLTMSAISIYLSAFTIGFLTTLPMFVIPKTLK